MSLRRVNRNAKEHGLVVLGLVVYEKAPVHRPEPTQDRPAKEELQHPDQDSG